MDFDALDLLAAIEAAPEATRRRTAGALTRQLSACGQRKGAVDDDGAGISSIAAGQPPSQDQAVEQAAPHGSSAQRACRACRTGCRTAGQSRATAGRKNRRTKS